MATPLLLPVLAEAGHLDLAYELLQRAMPPSWLVVTHSRCYDGLEAVEGVDVEGQAHMSLNHYSKGAVILDPCTNTRRESSLWTTSPCIRPFRAGPTAGWWG